MFIANEDLTIDCTRGDAGVLAIKAYVNDGENNLVPYMFQVGDEVRFSVCTKKNYSDVVLEKTVEVSEETDTVEIQLDSTDTKIGEGINKPTEFWYTVELNPDSENCQTIIGHDKETGARVLTLYPEAVKQGG